ncbi:MAG: gfo/Idh/MocA family oxidoreductase [Armatimonadia bacterium]|nr:gfo/Idh/MocA family oxidoreductase [Armatimonadia bacterium]
MENGTHSKTTRRDFLRGAAAGLTAAAALSGYSRAFAQGGGTLRAGLIGCGGRGTGAANDFIRGPEDTEVIALADLFPEKMDLTRERLGDRIDVPDDMCFSGFDCYEKILQTDIDVILIASPPHFRPAEFAAAIAAGKHVFMEKPLGVDPVGVRQIMITAEEAEEKGLAVVIGTIKRHQESYLEAYQRVQDGAIGEITALRAYHCGGPLGGWDRTDESPTIEEQVRAWQHWTWLSGDHIVEQQIHNSDVCNWFKGDWPVSAYGMGYRARKTYGNGYDFFCIDFEFADGVHMQSMARQQPDCDNNVSEAIVGSMGECRVHGGGAEIRDLDGNVTWEMRGNQGYAYVQEHIDMVASIRAGQPLNEARDVAQSTLAAIMGRESAYSGRTRTWEDTMNANLDLGPVQYELGATFDPRPTPTPGTIV